MHDDTSYATDDHLPPLPDYLADMERPDPILADPDAERIATQDEMPPSHRSVALAVLGIAALVALVILMVVVLG